MRSVNRMSPYPPTWRRSRRETARMIDEKDVLILAGVAGLEIDPAHLPGVTNNLRILLEQAALLMTPSIAAEIEPGAIFRA